MTEEARDLWLEYKTQASLYSLARYRGLLRRIKNLAQRLDWSADGDMDACMYLDAIAVNSGIEIGPK